MKCQSCPSPKLLLHPSTFVRFTVIFKGPMIVVKCVTADSMVLIISPLKMTVYSEESARVK